MAFVYLLCDSGHDKMFKIGTTRGKIDKRIKQLQTGNGSEIFLVDFYETKYPFFIERSLHLRFFNEKQVNEWFELSSEDVFNFKEYCQFYENNAKSLEDNPFMKKYLK
jgi:hypothetical protein